MGTKTDCLNSRPVSILNGLNSKTLLLHYKLGVTCVYNEYVFYTLAVIKARPSNSPISKFIRPCNEFRMSGQCSHAIEYSNKDFIPNYNPNVDLKYTSPM